MEMVKVMRPAWLGNGKDGACGHVVKMVIVKVMTMAGSSVLEICWEIWGANFSLNFIFLSGKVDYCPFPPKKSTSGKGVDFLSAVGSVKLNLSVKFIAHHGTGFLAGYLMSPEQSILRYRLKLMLVATNKQTNDLSNVRLIQKGANHHHFPALNNVWREEKRKVNHQTPLQDLRQSYCFPRAFHMRLYCAISPSTSLFPPLSHNIFAFPTRWIQLVRYQH